ncbi:MAG: hypothetical protein EPO07_19550 [Verrucomicrobia bacterium]|nr:MAG: hypothetical protein EPO07_19550 [Verrucomicrobiota bacterium]
MAFRLLKSDGMMGLMILMGWVGAGVIAELIAALRAPLGYQDETGFHFGQREVRPPEDWEIGNPS